MTNRSITMGALLLMLTSAAPAALSAQIPDSVIPLQTVISETNRFRHEYADYYNNKDVERLVGMYAADAILVNADGTAEVGQAAIKAYFTKGAPNFPHMVLKSESLAAYGQTAVDMGTVTLHPQEGGELVNRYLVVLRRTYKEWHVVRVMVVPVK